MLIIVFFVIFASSTLIVFLPALYLRNKSEPLIKENWFDRYTAYQYGWIYVCQKHKLAKNSLIVFVKIFTIIHLSFAFLTFITFIYEVFSIYWNGAVKVPITFIQRLTIISYLIYKYFPLNITALILLSDFLINRIVSVILYFKYKTRISFSLLDRLMFFYTFYVRLYEYSKESEKNRKRVNALLMSSSLLRLVVVLIWPIFAITYVCK